MTDDQVKVVAARIPISIDSLDKCVLLDDDDDIFGSLGSRLSIAYGEEMLELMKDYHYAKNWQEYHQRGIFVILHHCASQVPIHDD